MRFCFILDNMLPRDLVAFPISQGHEAHTRGRLKTGSTTDEALWAKAEEMAAVLITKDADFSAIVQGSRKAQLIHYQGGNVDTSQLLRDFQKNLSEILIALEAGELLIQFK